MIDIRSEQVISFAGIRTGVQFFRHRWPVPVGEAGRRRLLQ